MLVICNLSCYFVRIGNDFLSSFINLLASLMLYQQKLDDITEVVFPVEGLATIPIGGLFAAHYALNCISSNTSGSSIVWSRADGATLNLTQRLIPNGVQLDFENIVSYDLTVYICLEATTSELVRINVTDGK